jgi:hypothetical protein
MNNVFEVISSKQAATFMKSLTQLIESLRRIPWMLQLTLLAYALTPMIGAIESLLGYWFV